jgi:soluble lytic murein transglycosylase-like protein
MKPTSRASRCLFLPLAIARTLYLLLFGLLMANPTVAQIAKDSAITASQQTAGDLSATYEEQVRQLEQRLDQSKQLYDEGLIARVQVDADEKALADARAKLAETNNRIALAKQSAAANSSASIALAASASDQPWTTGDSRIDSLIRYYGRQYGVDAYLIYCLMSQESGFSNRAVSPKGAQGLMQLMPATAARYGVSNPFDVAQSIMGGAHYLKDLLQMFSGRVDLALAAYNAGENAVIKYGYTVPPYQETRDYVRLISARYAKKKTS